MTAASDTRTLERARKLLGLWRGAQGGEKLKARGALMRLLETGGLYLSDLEAGLPRTRDPELVPEQQQAQNLHHLALLESPQQRDEALLFLVDAPELTPEQRQQVLLYLDIGQLARSRAAGWAAIQPDPEVTAEAVAQAAAGLTEHEVAYAAGPTLAQSIHDLSLLRAARLVRPERQLRAADEFQAAFLLSLCATLSGVPARSEAQGGQYLVTAYLSANELSQVRARQAREQEGFRRELLQAARQFGQRIGYEKM